MQFAVAKGASPFDGFLLRGFSPIHVAKIGPFPLSVIRDKAGLNPEIIREKPQKNSEAIYISY